jgi:hypothetical protein
MKPHYFDDPAGAAGDFMLTMAKGQGYVPRGCLLGGQVVMAETNAGRDACAGCEGPRNLCGGRPKRDAQRR